MKQWLRDSVFCCTGMILVVAFSGCGSPLNLGSSGGGGGGTEATTGGGTTPSYTETVKDNGTTATSSATTTQPSSIQPAPPSSTSSLTYTIEYYKAAEPAQSQFTDNTIPNVTDDQGNVLVLDITSWPTGWDLLKIITVRMPSGTVQYKRLLSKFQLSDGRLAIGVTDANLLEVVDNCQIDVDVQSGSTVPQAAAKRPYPTAKDVTFIDTDWSQPISLVKRDFTIYGGDTSPVKVSLDETNLTISPHVTIKLIIDRPLWSIPIDIFQNSLNNANNAICNYLKSIQQDSNGVVINLGVEAAKDIVRGEQALTEVSYVIQIIKDVLHDPSRLKEFKVTAQGNINGWVTYSMSASGSYNPDPVTIRLLPTLFVPIPAPIPIEFTAQALAKASMEFDAEAKVTGGATLSAPFHADFEIQNGQVLAPVNTEMTPTLTKIAPSFECQGNFEVAAGIECKMGISLALIADLTVDPTTELVFNAEGTSTATAQGGYIDFGWKLFPRFDMGLEASVELLGSKTLPIVSHNFDPIASGDYLYKWGTVAPPTFNPPDGTPIPASGLDVLISCADLKATIRYTIDGTIPSRTNGIVYNKTPIPLAQTTTLKAIAYEDNMADSTVCSATYTYTQPGTVSLPTFNPPDGTGIPQGGFNVTISCSTSGVTIRYTTDGTTPSTSNGTVIASGGTIFLDHTATIQAIAYKVGMTSSPIAHATYTYTQPGQVASPTFNPPNGTTIPQTGLNVAISCSTPGATIRYTVDSSTPSRSNGTSYNGSVPLTATTTIKAMAFKDGMTDSSVSSATYNYSGGDTPTITVASPNGGQSWQAGSTYTITWTMGGDTSVFNYIWVAYSLDGGGSFTNIGSSPLPPTSTSLNWTIPSGTSSTQARIRVRAMDVNQYIKAQDTSDASFTITSSNPGPSISYVSPTSMSADNNLHTFKVYGSNFSTSGAHLLFTDPQGNLYTSATYPSREGPITATEFDYQINNGNDPGTWTVRVQNLDGKKSDPVSFQVVSSNVTLTLYVHDGSATGPVLSGVSVAGDDAAGNGFAQTTNSSGYVTISGVPGTWSFSIYKTGYQQVSWSESITSTCTKNAFFASSVPASPTSLSAVGLVTCISLFWTDNSNNESGFKIERKVGASGTYSYYASAGANSVCYIDYNVTKGITYYYRLYAYNASGPSKYYTNESYTSP